MNRIMLIGCYCGTPLSCSLISAVSTSTACPKCCPMHLLASFAEIIFCFSHLVNSHLLKLTDMHFPVFLDHVKVWQLFCHTDRLQLNLAYKEVETFNDNVLQILSTPFIVNYAIVSVTIYYMHPIRCYINDYPL